MSKKRDLMKRRRQISRARSGTGRAARAKGHQKQTPAREGKSGGADLWIAAAIVVLLVGAIVALYYLAVRRPKKVSRETVEEVAAMASWTEPPPMSIDLSKTYEAVIKTEKGDVRLELYDDIVSVTVNNFVFLSRQGFYDGVTFHRVIPGFMAQTGDPTGTGSGGPGYRFGDEFDDTLRHDGEGIVSMANAGPDTNGSQFLIIYAPQPHLDDLHAVFGRVIEGMEVVRGLSARDPSEGPDAPSGTKILTIEIIER